MTDKNPKQLNPATLAFLGDAVFELKVRESLAIASLPANTLHKTAIGMVCAAAQAQAYLSLEPILSEEELAVMKRGRNAHSSHVPKNAKVGDYRMATGVETLFGYLYLLGNSERIDELFDLVNVNVQVKNEKE